MQAADSQNVRCTCGAETLAQFGCEGVFVAECEGGQHAKLVARQAHFAIDGQEVVAAVVGYASDGKIVGLPTDTAPLAGRHIACASDALTA